MADSKPAPQAQEIEARALVYRSPIDEQILTDIAPPTPAAGVRDLRVNEASYCVTVEGLSVARVYALVNFSLSYLTVDGKERNIDSNIEWEKEVKLPETASLNTAPRPAVKAHLRQRDVCVSRSFLAGDSSGRVGCLFDLSGILEVTAVVRLRVLTVPPVPPRHT